MAARAAVCLAWFGAAAWAQGAPPGEEERRLQDMADLLDTPVISASQLLQDPSQAPAKVVVITAEDLRRRGYTDLEEVLHDLAGFDFEKGYGSHWSQIYMRGERSTNSDRFLFIWDGLIQNDIWAQVTWLERQFPLSNIERIEVMYGPASLLYGTNAIGGIINVITKRPERVDGVELQLRTGSLGTRLFEANGGQARGDFRWSFTYKLLEADTRDLTNESWTDNAGRTRHYGLQFPGDFDLQALSQNTSTDRAGATHSEYEPNDPQNPGGGGRFWIMKNGYWTPFDGRFGRPDRDWFAEAGVGWRGWDLKVQSWLKNESEEGWTTPQSLLKASWNSASSSVRLTNKRKLSEAWESQFHLLMRTSELDPSTEEPDFSVSPGWDPASTGPIPKVVRFGPFIYYKLFNREYRVGDLLRYQGQDLSGVVGAEFVAAKVYENYYTRTEDDQPWKFTPQHNDRNLAVFGNVQAQLSPLLNLSAGVRFDHNWEAGGRGGFGNNATTRAAAIFTPAPHHTVKLIYGQAFQAPSAFQKYSQNPNRPYRSPDLKPERMDSLELDYGYAPASGWRLQAATYLNQVENKIKPLPVPGQPQFTQFQNQGQLEVFGGELEAKYRFDPDRSAYLNLTANSARDRDTGRHTGGIAPIQAQFGTDLLFAARWSASLRGHWVPRRRTDAWDSPNLLTASAVPAYLTFDLTLAALNVWKGADLRLSILNLTDQRYYDPGVRSVSGTYYNGAILQLPFRAYVGVTWRF